MSQTHTLTSFRFLIALIIITIVSLQVIASADRKLPNPTDRGSKYEADELLVKFKPGVAAVKANAIARGTGARSVKRFRRPRQLKSSAIDHWRHVKLNPGSDIDTIRTRLLKNPNVELVEYNYKISAHLIPNDPEFAQLWGLHNSGQSGGLAGADIDAPEAWDISTGNSNVVVAVIDTGVDYNHEDLATNMWVNPGEIAGNGIDDDGNGYIDDVYGYDFFNNDADPMDDVWHGTHVSGTIAGVANNGIGVTGVSWNARIMAIKFLSPEGGLVSGAASAILYATDMGATVMNNSWGGYFYSQIVKDAIADAEASGVLFVASAGNDHYDNDRSPVYPASYDLPNIITVAATDHNDNKADFSNYGATTVDLGAPGDSIYSTTPNAGYAFAKGTSMASPHVSGAAALLLSKYPLLNYTQIKSRLMLNVDQVSGMLGLTASNGRLNIFRAIEDDTINPATINDLAINIIENFSITLNWTASGDDNNNGTPHHYDLRYSNAPIDDLNFDTASTVDDVIANGPAGTLESIKVTNLKPGTEYYFAIKAVDNVGNSSSLSNILTVNTEPARAIFYDNFEWGSDNWEIWSRRFYGSGSLVSWHLSTQRSNSPVTALYYGDEETLTYKSKYTTSGGIISVPIDLTTATEAGFYFNHFLDIKRTDTATIGVRIVENGTYTSHALLSMQKGTQGKFVPIHLDLSSYVGQIIQLEFRITSDASGSIIESYEGWILDDIEVFVPETINNQPPSANPGGPYAVFRNEPLTFNSSASTDPDGDSLLYKWDFGDGSRGSGANVTHRYSGSGTYTVTLIVNDGVLDSEPVSTSVTVTNQVPVANAGGPYSGYKNVAINFDGLASIDEYGTALTYLWDFGDGTSGTGSNPSHSYSSLGDYKVQLTVNDGEVDSATVSTTVSINNRAPTAYVVGLDYTFYKYNPVNFNGLGSSDADGDSLTYLWDFDDGTTGTGATPIHSYSAQGLYNVSLIVNDGLENSAPAITSVAVYNRLPVAHAGGPYSAFRNEVISFNGLASYDRDGDTLSYRWDFGDRKTATGVTPDHAYTSSGTYTVSLRVFDGEKYSLESSIASVTINNRPPVADAGGPYSGYINDSIQFNGQNSGDPDGDTLTYDWTFYENCNISSCRGSGVTPSYKYTERGDHLVTLTVSDGESSSTSTAIVTINNQQPTAVVNGGPYDSSKNTAIHFSSFGTSDLENDALSYHWDFGDGTTSIEPFPIHSYNSTGTYVVTLTVNDGYGDSVPATTKATIYNRIPTAKTGGPYSGYKQTVITFDGSGSQDPDGDVLSYQWHFGDGTSGTGVTPAHSYNNSGTYTVTLVVTDGEANSALESTTVSIINRVPLADLGGQYADDYKNELISFDGSGSTDADGDSISYLWDFGDGTSGTGVTPAHSYSNSGTYTVTLVVTDGEANSTLASTTVNIINRVPLSDLGGQYADIYKNDSVSFDGSGSTDADGDSISYQWDFGDGNTGTGINPIHSYANMGTYTISLTVSDGEVNSNTVSTNIRVLNRAPVANAGTDQVVSARSVVTLDGSTSTDPDGTIVSYHWAQSSGTSVILNNANTAKPTFSVPALKGAKQLILTFALTVTDDDGMQSVVDKVIVTVVKN